MTKSKTVAILGAGPYGIVCAKVLLDDGFDVILFEREKEIGGIWSAKSAYADLHCQQPGGTLEFSDLYNGEEFAPWQHVHEYLQQYADLFHITERIRCQTRVISVSKDDLKDAAIPWTVKIATADGREESKEFGFVIVATGLFSEPYVPTYPGENRFAGVIVSPSTIKSHTQIANKRVVVVGYGKCAADMAVLAGRYAHSCHLIFRKAHWLTPRYILGGLLPIRMLYTRVFSVPFTPIPGAPHNHLFRFLHKAFPKIFTMMTNSISNDIMAIHGSDLSDDQIFIPQHSFQKQENISIISNDFLRLKHEGRISGRLDTVDEIIDETTIRLHSGEELQADMIISATGFIQKFPFFSTQDAQLMGMESSNGHIQLNLYRRVIPVGIPNIAFIGYTNSVSNWMIAEVGSHWISDYFLQRIQLPHSKDEMYKEIQTAQTFIKEVFSREVENYRYYWIAPMETYLKDMGLDLHRTSNWISEYFGIYRPKRLKGLHYERKHIAETGHRPRRFYFSFKLTIALILFIIFLNFFIL